MTLNLASVSSCEKEGSRVGDKSVPQTLSSAQDTQDSLRTEGPLGARGAPCYP